MSSPQCGFNQKSSMIPKMKGDYGGFFFKCCGLMRFYFVTQTHPHLQPRIRFLFVRPEFCPLGDLWTPKIRLSSGSASRRAPLPLAKSSRYRAASGLSSLGTCAHRAHIKKAVNFSLAATGQRPDFDIFVFSSANWNL